METNRTITTKRSICLRYQEINASTMYSPAKSARIGSTCSAMCPLGTLCCICSGTNDSGRHWRGNGTWFWHAFKWNAERTDPYFPFHELGYRRYARQRNRNPFVRKFPAQKKQSRIIEMAKTFN